jgi:hypothetical protein
MKFLLLFIIISPYLIKCFEEISIEILVKEEQENGTEIIDLQKRIASLSKLNKFDGYKMRFVRQCEYLYIDELKLRSLKIDREQICRYEKECLITCDLLIEDEEMKLIKLKIKIEDINDHKPKFMKKSYYYEINEENLLFNNSLIELEQAEDEDLIEMNNYYLNCSNDFPFKINFNKENHFLELILIKNVEKDKYLFELIVDDELNQSDKCLIEIKIIPNDFNPPEFDLNLYEFVLYNFNSTFIGKVNVKNHSLKKIFYRFISSFENLFEINSTTGQIYLKSNQNFNSFDHFYQLFIEASYDNSISSLTTVHIYFNLTSSSSSSSIVSQDLFIQILIPKLFQKNQNQNQIFIKENSSIPLTILQLFTSSSSSSLQINSSIQQNYFHLKQLDQQSFELILLKSLDYEINQIIYLDFFIQNLTKKSIEIFIENINDCQPTFNQTKFHFQIKENNHFPFLLHTFQAFDQDFLNNLTYHIQTTGENLLFLKN